MSSRTQLLAVPIVCACVLLATTAPAAAQSAGPPPLLELAKPCTPLTGNPTPFGGGGGANNIVIVHNPAAGGLHMRGSVQINHVLGPTVGSTNCAAALGGSTDPALAGPGCTGCETLAVALQIDLISRTATRVAPSNVARAENVRCTGCLAVAVAMQYVIPVDDPGQVPPDAAALAARMDSELRAMQSDHSLTALQAVDRIVAITQQFTQLAQELSLQRSDAV